jgi:hypothetical protein
MPSSTRRALLAAAGTVALAGCISLDRLTDRSTPDPPPFLTEPTDWAHSHHDAGNTGAAPDAATPDALADEPARTTSIGADEVRHVHTPTVADGVVYLPFQVYGRGEELVRRVDRRGGVVGEA